jgi:LysM repeat protein
MRFIFGNSCARGCLVYAVVLVVVLVAGSMGLEGLRARFGMNKPELTTMSAGATVPGVQVTLPNPADVLGSGGGSGTGLAIPSGDGADGGDGGPVVTVPTSTPIPLPLPVPIPQPVPQPTPGQGGTITGEVSEPFYVVQPGDTLWSISQQVGLSVDALRAANGISGDLIYPGQVLVLPANGTAPPGPPSTGAGSPPPASMPQPGTGDQDQQSEPVVPNMPDTGILKNKP